MKIFRFTHEHLSAFYMVDDFGGVKIRKDLATESREIGSALSESEVIKLADEGTLIPYNLKAAVALQEYRDTNRKKRNISLTILGLGVVVMVLSIVNGWWL